MNYRKTKLIPLKELQEGQKYILHQKYGNLIDNHVEVLIYKIKRKKISFKLPDGGNFRLVTPKRRKKKPTEIILIHMNDYGTLWCLRYPL